MGMTTSMRLAQSILNGFDAYFADFQNITLAAKARFERAQWQATQKASADRLNLYRRKVSQLHKSISFLAGDESRSKQLWRLAKSDYEKLLTGHSNYEIAETFFNTIYGNVFNHRDIENENAFVFSAARKKKSNTSSVFTSYSLQQSVTKLVTGILDDFKFDIPYENRDRDVVNIVEVASRHIFPANSSPSLNEEGSNNKIIVDVLESTFFRNKAAYLVGRVRVGRKITPLVIPLLNNEQGGVYVDTLIHEEKDLSIIFSFARSYFMVDTRIPSEIVGFLQSLMPQKSVAELYNCIGFKQHGKTEFYRRFIRHLQNSNDKFVVASGIPGMVMSVFTLPSWNMVFKVIKDKCDPPKDVSKKTVIEKYKMVTRHDRVGRMADTQEFKQLVFDRDRFSEELMEELQKVAPSQIRIKNDKVTIKHLYVERKMNPLNLYLLDASDAEIFEVMDEYGNAIKQLAGANIFPGDMLLKNFGVTRHKRVVFYDYDEICPIMDCNFRRIPAATTEEQELSGEVWYSVADNDIFPEEFRYFFSGNPTARRAFEELHSELYDVEYWKQLQQDIRDGKVLDIYPYRRKKRFTKTP